MSEIWCQLCDLLDVKRSTTSGCSLQANGQAERTNQTVKQLLRVAFADNINWVRALDTVEMSINRAVTTSGFSPYYLNLGYEPTLFPDVEHSEMVENTLNESPETFLHRMQDDWGTARAALTDASEKGIAQVNRHRRDAQFAVGDWVLVRMFPKARGPALATIMSCLRALPVPTRFEP